MVGHVIAWDIWAEGPLNHPISRWAVGLSVLTGALATVWKAWGGPAYRKARDAFIDTHQKFERMTDAVEAVHRDLIPEGQPSLAKKLEQHMLDASTRIGAIEKANRVRDRKVTTIASDVAEIRKLMTEKDGS